MTETPKFNEGHTYLANDNTQPKQGIQKILILTITETCYHVRSSGHSEYRLIEDFDKDMDIVEDLGVGIQSTKTICTCGKAICYEVSGAMPKNFEAGC